jgi:hypothetical protein
MNETIQSLVVGAVGAAVQEIAHWYGLRHRLSESKVQALAKSTPYWSITALMVIASGLGTWAWYGGNPQALRTYFLTGAAFPLVLKKAVSVFGRGLHLGAGAPERAVQFSLQEYFQ